MTTNPIENACRLLREGAAELKNCHTLAAMGHDWTGEPEAKAAYDEHMATADALERVHAECETLRTGYAAARLEIESLQRRVQEVGAAARREHERADRAMRAAQPAAPDVSGYVSEWAGGLCTSDEAMDGIAKLYAAQPAGAQQPGAAYAALPAGTTCSDCGGTGRDGDAGDDGRTIDIECGTCDGSGIVGRYRDACPGGGRCLQGCLNNQPCYYHRASHGQAPAQATPAAPSLPSGWSFDVKRSDGRVWLTISTPHGASATLSAAEKTGNGDDTIVAQVLDYLAAPAAVAGPIESVKFVDQSTADPVEKARRYLTAMGDQRTNSAYFYDDGYPRRESAQDALATLAVLEQLAAAPTTQPAPQQEAQEPVAWRVHPFDAGIGCKGVYAVTQFPHLRDQWERKCWKVEPLYTAPQPSPASQGDALDAARMGWLNPSDMAALERVNEYSEDGVGYDIPASKMKRMAELGVVQSLGFGRYGVTSFGRIILGSSHLRKPLETVEECNSRLGREHQAQLEAARAAQEGE